MENQESGVSSVRKLENLSGEGNVRPGELGLTNEQGRLVCERFENRLMAETDIEKVVEGIIPAQSVLDLEAIPSEIMTQNGTVNIYKEGKVARAVNNVISKLVKINEAAARYQKYRKRITVTSEMDSFSTVVAVARGNFRSVVGPKIAHEAIHAYQDVEHPQMDLELASGIVKRAVELQKSDTDLSLVEAIQLEGRSRDGAILTETQAYLMSYMLSGGDMSAETITTIKKALVQADTKVGGESVLLDDIPLSRYSEGGFAPIEDLVMKEVISYMPKKDRGNGEYANRIHSATVQMVRLLDSGVGHRQIADLLRENYQGINSDQEWDEATGEYKFLSKFIHAQDIKPEGEELVLKRFNGQNEERAIKIKRIATEELTR